MRAADVRPIDRLGYTFPKGRAGSSLKVLEVSRVVPPFWLFSNGKI